MCVSQSIARPAGLSKLVSTTTCDDTTEIKNTSTSDVTTDTGWPTNLLFASVPLSSIDGVGGDVGPVNVSLAGVPVQSHGVPDVSQRNDIIKLVFSVEADSSDVRPSGKKQELVKT